LNSTERQLDACQQIIGYYFSNPDLLETALTHSSLRAPDRECNERLEFLGDSVLGLVITEELYHLLPDQSEGELTRIKSAVVSRSALLSTSQRLGLQRFAEFARGVGRRDKLPASVVANLVEAVIGAIYLDAGYYPAREFVLRHMGDAIDDELNDRGAKNYKSLLQHEVQQAVGVTPTYRTLDADGPDHAKEFVVAAVIRGQAWGEATGPTKKDAEQEAARLALEAWGRRGRGRRRRRKRRSDGNGASEDGAPEGEVDLEVDLEDGDDEDDAAATLTEDAALVEETATSEDVEEPAAEDVSEDASEALEDEESEEERPRRVRRSRRRRRGARAEDAERPAEAPPEPAAERPLVIPVESAAEEPAPEPVPDVAPARPSRRRSRRAPPEERPTVRAPVEPAPPEPVAAPVPAPAPAPAPRVVAPAPPSPAPKPPPAGFAAGIDVPRGARSTPPEPTPVETKKVLAPARKPAPRVAREEDDASAGGFAAGI